MPKLSDKGYSIPIIEALEANRVLGSGRTRPMLVRGVNRNSGQTGEFVVKLSGSPEMFPGASMKEMLASFIALELDLQVPEPVVVNISQDLVDLMTAHENYLLASKSLGFNFGTTLMDQYQPIVTGQPLSSSLEHSLCELFAFDIFIGNTDRRKDKHNFLTNGKELLIFDHEMAFSFTSLLSVARNPAPWIITKEDMDWIANNYCYDRLKGNKFDFSNFAARLSVIDNNFWKKAEEAIPADWMNNQFEDIAKTLSQIVSKRNDFGAELNRVFQ